MKKKIHYVAVIDSARNKGLLDKIQNTIEALKDAGYASHSVLCNKEGMAGALMMRQVIKNLNSDLIILRNRGAFGLFLVDILVRKRLHGTKIVVDIPTPIRNAILEVWGHKKNLFNGLFEVFLLLLAHPWCDIPANRIIEYGEEDGWFLFGLRKKTVLLGNGVSVSRLPLLNSLHHRPNQRLTLIGVSSLCFWHGYDRIIRGLSEYDSFRRSTNSTHVDFLIVGEGPDRDRLQSLVSDLNLSYLVHFLGYLEGPSLIKSYESANIAISAIGAHRKKLFVASPLKSREALAMGLPIVYSYRDPDFSEDLPFTYKIAADDTAANILEIVGWYQKLCGNSFEPAWARDFAMDKLDFSKKIWPYTNLLN